MHDWRWGTWLTLWGTLACGNTVTFIGGAGGQGGADPSGGAGAAGAVTTTGEGGAAVAVTSATSSSTTTGTSTSSTSSGTGGGSCMDVELATERVTRPVDAILLVENLFSQNDLQGGIEANLYPNFVQVLEGLGLDLQVIVVSDHGANPQQLCVPPPLSGTTQCSGPPVEVPGSFRHYDVSLPPNQGVCRMLDTLYGANSGGQPDDGLNGIPSDGDAIHPNGWAPFLRVDAYKAIVAVTTNRMACAWNAPGQFLSSFCDPTPSNPDPVAQKSCYNDDNSPDQSATTSPGAWAAKNLRDRMVLVAPGQFGSTDGGQNFGWFSLVNVAAKGGNPATPYAPSEPVVTQTCSGFGSFAAGHQWLSRGTDGPRLSACTPSLDLVFQSMAADVVSAAEDRCAYTVELEAPDGTGVVLQVDGANGLGELTPVASAAACQGDDEFYLEGDVARLCPLACTAVEADPNAEVQAVALCDPP